MRRRVSAEMGRLPLSAYDTVLIETPAASATSLIFTIADSVVCDCLWVEALRGSASTVMLSAG